MAGIDPREQAGGVSLLIADLTNEAEVRDVFARIYHETGRYGDAILIYHRLSRGSGFNTTRLLAE